MTNKELEHLFQETAIVYGALAMVHRPNDGIEKLVSAGLMETWYFVADEDDK